MNRTTENAPWWASHRRNEPPHMRLIPLFEQIETASNVLQQNTRRLLAMYEYGASSEGVSYTGDTNRESLRHVPVENYLMTFPHAANVIDTLHAKLCKARIDPFVMTEGANFFSRKRSEKLNKALKGELEESSFESIKERVVLDLLVTDHGMGAAMVSSPFGKIQIDYVPIDDLYFDEAECRYGKPRSVFRKWRIDRYQALELYASLPSEDEVQDENLFGSVEDRTRAILNAPRADLVNTQSLGDDQIILIEAWHLRSGPRAKDGRHTIALSGATLFDEQYDRDSFPFAFAKGLPRPRSIYGRSTMRLLAPAQREHDIATTKLQTAHAMTGTHIAVPRGANIDVREIDNDVATIFEYDGPQPPITFNPEAINGQFYQYRNGLVQEMRQSVGMNEMSTSGQVPAGLSNASGRALRVFQSQENERHLVAQRGIERFVVDLCWLVVDEAKAISENDPKYASRYIGKNGVEKLPWKELLKDKDDFVIRIAPVSALASDPSGKIDDVKELLQMGLITTAQATRMVDVGLDVQEEMSIELAPDEALRRKFDTIIEHGRYVGPIPHDNLDMGISLASKYINRLETEGDDMGEAVDMLNQWIMDAEAMKKAAAPPPPMPPMPAPGGPGAEIPPPPMPPPPGMPTM